MGRNSLSICADGYLLTLPQDCVRLIIFTYGILGHGALRVFEGVGAAKHELLAHKRLLILELVDGRQVCLLSESLFRVIRLQERT